ncbi:MAG TPA: MFS transporter [Oligoflexus sp.]|uniref:MFS transporter n=1 Tax=Oligoflexus sp. TaxID=1971216 RepID=UPI002D4B6329|nr:MFS transporter [Oligoflexus sp.]HYX35486.1 MFS transporter [Oligoflexus sp.]
MLSHHQADSISFWDFRSAPMRAFHMSWMAFFLCFFAWFGSAALMGVIREELQLSKSQIGHIITGSVAITIIFRLLMGGLLERVGPRRLYAGLLILGSIPVIAIAFTHTYETFLMARVAIGAIGASFVISQYHTTQMFSSRIVGTANAITAGWGNMGGGATHLVMPLLFAGIMMLGFSQSLSWRLSMIVVGILCCIMGILYYRFTQDTPDGDLIDLRREGRLPPPQKTSQNFSLALRDYRVWILALMYGLCFGLELTIDNIAALYFIDYFQLNIQTAGFAAASFGMMNIFSRALGGYLGDVWGRRRGLNGRVSWLALVILGEGLSLIGFAQMSTLGSAIGLMLVFSLFCQMACGATYAVVPFIQNKALGPVAGLVGAGGNVGAIATGLLFGGGIAWPTALLYLGFATTVLSGLALFVRQREPRRSPEAALAYRAAVES